MKELKLGMIIFSREWGGLLKDVVVGVVIYSDLEVLIEFLYL